MRMIFEFDGQEDFLELILTDSDIKQLETEPGIMLDYPYGLHGFRNLNIFLRKEKYAPSERKKSV